MQLSLLGEMISVFIWRHLHPGSYKEVCDHCSLLATGYVYYDVCNLYTHTYTYTCTYIQGYIYTHTYASGI